MTTVAPLGNKVVLVSGLRIMVALGPVWELGLGVGVGVGVAYGLKAL